MPELRKDPVMGRWVIIATERSKRPHDFQHAQERRRGGPCVFCAGREEETPAEVLAYRNNGSSRDSAGWSVRVVPNKFPALRIEGELGRRGEGLYDVMNGLGAHEVIVETPDHAADLADLSESQVEEVLWAYHDRILDLRKDRRFRFILIFKNHGIDAGASLEHAHSQLIALPIVPLNVAEELQGAKEYYQYKERCVFCDIVRQELETGARLVAENEDFVTLCPFAPRFPFEMWILPKQHGAAFENATKHEYQHLARALRDALRRLNRVLGTPPFNFMVHSLPLHDADNGYYHWHIEIMPKLTTVAGFEWGTGFYINPTPPEEAARALREAGD
jgi:UDPglucose--hexose-1-phosphate uridylyltransferase